MGKNIIISGADYSEVAIPIAKAVFGTASPQFVYAANVVTPGSDFNWDAHKVEIQIQEDGSILDFNLPVGVTALPKFARGGGASNTWIEEIDLSRFSMFPLVSFRAMLSGSTELKRAIIGGTFGSVTGDATTYYMFEGCPLLDDVVIDESFDAPNMSDIRAMFYSAGVRSVTGLKNLVKSTIVRMDYLFNDCRNIREIDLTGCNTENVISFSNMFRLCYSLSRIKGIEGLDTSSVSDYTRAFEGVGQIGKLDLSNWIIAANAITNRMFLSANIYELNANCFTALYGDISYMFYLGTWNTIHLDNLNDVSLVSASTDLFSSYVTGTPKVTIANVTNTAVKNMLKGALNAKSVGGSSDWQEATIDGVLCLVPSV